MREKVFGKSYSLENSLRESIFREDLSLHNCLQFPEAEEESCASWFGERHVRCTQFNNTLDSRVGRRSSTLLQGVPSATWVGLNLIWVFHHLAQLLIRFCQINTSPSRIRQTVQVQHSKFKSTQPSARVDGTHCISDITCTTNYIALDCDNIWYISMPESFKT